MTFLYSTCPKVVKTIWAALCKKIPNFLSHCHTKRRTGMRGLLVWHRLFQKKNLKSRWPRSPVLLLVWQRLRTLGTFLHDIAHLISTSNVLPMGCEFWALQLSKAQSVNGITGCRIFRSGRCLQNVDVKNTTTKMPYLLFYGQKSCYKQEVRLVGFRVATSNSVNRLWKPLLG